MPRRLLTDLMTGIPGIFLVIGPGTGEVRARFVDHRDLESFRLRLALSRDIDMHAVQFSIAIGIEGRFDPQIVLDPLLRILEFFDHLGLAIDEQRLRRWHFVWNGDAVDQRYDGELDSQQKDDAGRDPDAVED